jgi:hypothetical protein
MTDIATLLKQLEELKDARRTGALKIRFGDRETTYRSDEELSRAIADLQREIGAEQGLARPTSITIRSNKGW